jgi:hypothetical protein
MRSLPGKLTPRPEWVIGLDHLAIAKMSGVAMSGRACVLAVLMALGGCAAMPEAIPDVSQSASVSQVDASTVTEAEDESTGLERRTPTRASRMAQRRSSTSTAVAGSSAVKVKSSAVEDTDEPNPDRATAARRMDEQSQRWNTAAKRAIGSICAGC